MTRNRRITVAKISAITAAVPVLLYAFAAGPDPGHTGAPQDQNGATCTACHGGTANSGPGSVTISFPGSSYTPGVKQRVKVTVADPNQQRWGFQLTARLASDGKTQGGRFASVDGNTQVLCTNTSLVEQTTCTDGLLEFIEHTAAGTRRGQTGSADFEFDWTPPSTNVGEIVFYAAGNAANGNGNNTGDLIYTTTARLSPAATSQTPLISEGGVVNGASFRSGIAPNTWVTIKGERLSATTRIWGDSDFVDGNLPKSLDGVSVKINGKDTYVYYISQEQVNVLAPVDLGGTGPMQVAVTNANGTSNTSTTTAATFAPAFFLFNGDKYIAALRQDNTLLGPTTLFPGQSTPARPGETVQLFCTGLGPTNPAAPEGKILPGAAPIANTVTLRIGGVDVTPAFAGLTATGLYQLNAVVPESAANGDVPVVMQIGGVSSPDNTFITVQRP